MFQQDVQCTRKKDMSNGIFFTGWPPPSGWGDCHRRWAVAKRALGAGAAPQRGAATWWNARSLEGQTVVGRLPSQLGRRTAKWRAKIKGPCRLGYGPDKNSSFILCRTAHAMKSTVHTVSKETRRLRYEDNCRCGSENLLYIESSRLPVKRLNILKILIKKIWSLVWWTLIKVELLRRYHVSN